MKRIAPFLVTALAALPTLPVAAGAQTTNPAPDEWRFEVFASPGWSGLRTAAEDGWALTVAGPGAAAGPEDWTHRATGSRLSAGFGWGGGARLSRGPWGIEAAYRQIRSRDLTPSHLLLDTGAYSGMLDSIAAEGGVESVAVDPVSGTDPPLPRSRGDLFFGQVFRSFRLRPGAVLSVGLGGGHLRVTDDRTDELLARDWGVLPVPDFFEGWFEIDTGYTASRSRFVYGGSVALTTEVGSFLLRPRLDVVVPTGSLTTAFDYGLEVRDPETTQRLEGAYTSSVDPVLFLVSVEIGFHH